MAMTIKEHVIHRLNVETQRAEGPVTFTTIFKHSSRKKDDLKQAMTELIEDGVIGQLSTPPGKIGRPTTYFFLKKVWKEADDLYSPVRTGPAYIPTEEDNPYTERSFTDPSNFQWRPELPELHESFPVLAAMMINDIMDQGGITSHVEFIKKYQKSTAYDPHEVWIAYRRLRDPRYDEYWTKYAIVGRQVRRADGTVDRRHGDETGNVYICRGKLPNNVQNKKRIQTEDQESTRELDLDRGKTEDWIKERYQWPEPSDRVPDMSEIEKLMGLFRNR